MFQVVKRDTPIERVSTLVVPAGYFSLSIFRVSVVQHLRAEYRQTLVDRDFYAWDAYSGLLGREFARSIQSNFWGSNFAIHSGLREPMFVRTDNSFPIGLEVTSSLLCSAPPHP